MKGIVKKEKRKGNNKRKLVSILAAICLWMYVMIVVDPSDSKTIDDVSITIENQVQLSENRLVIYPKENLTTDIYVSGKLSDIQKLNKDNIKIYGNINNPIEGANIVVLKTNLNNNISRKLNKSTVTVNLEKKITKEANVVVNIDKGEELVENAYPKYDSVYVTGARTVISKLDKVIANIDVNGDNNKNKKITISSTLVPVDVDGNKLDLEVDLKKMDIIVNLFSEKNVPVELNMDDKEKFSGKYEFEPKMITIAGSEESLKDINAIKTEKISEETMQKMLNEGILNDQVIAETKNKNFLNLEIPKDIKSVNLINKVKLLSKK